MERALAQASEKATISLIRKNAAVLRGVKRDQPPNVPGVSLLWDARDGGFIFPRKHIEAVKASLGAVRVHTVEAAAANADQAPSDAKKEAGNYRKGKANWRGLALSIENAKGSKRTGTGRDGKKWAVTMPAHYGYVRGTVGADGDHVDFYMGDDEASEFVLLVDQKDTSTGTFDEHKIVLGTRDAGQALGIYNRGFSDGRGLERIGGVREMTVDELKNWLEKGRMKRPISRHLSEVDKLAQPRRSPPLSADRGSKPEFVAAR